MRINKLLEYIFNLANAFYCVLLKLSINAHQLIASWRDRIHRKSKFDPTLSGEATEQIDLKSQDLAKNSYKLEETGYKETKETHSLSYQIKNSSTNTSTPVGQSSQISGLPIKTPNPHRIRVQSIFRRLSIRKFMEYCVIALNEASSSGCSNKFDLSSCDSPVWLLGRQYALPQDADKLIDDIRSKLWITYRRNFPPIDENTRYTTDRGFGCMIRCGQMVLANALIYKNLGRDWRWSPCGFELNPEVYAKILKLFQDKEICPYSIHNIIRVSQQEGKVVGEWFGPNTIAQALKRISIANQVEATKYAYEVLISIDAALDNVVVMDEIKSRFKRKDAPLNSQLNPIVKEEVSDKQSNMTSGPKWLPGILFIQLRLGLSKINPLYFAALKKTFQFKNSLGIIGGRPNHALYLIGYTEDEIIYLDPHSTQQYVDFDKIDKETDERCQSDDQKYATTDTSYHCASPEKMSIDKLDPSLALCFYFHTEDEFDEWCSSSNELLIKSEQAPMFEITESRPLGWNVKTNLTTIPSCYDASSCQIRKAKLDALNEKSNNYFLTDLTEDDKEEAPVDKLTVDEEEFEMLG